MALPISVRLFLAGRVSMTLAGLVGLGLVRWRLGEGPTPIAAQGLPAGELSGIHRSSTFADQAACVEWRQTWTPQ